MFGIFGLLFGVFVTGSCLLANVLYDQGVWLGPRLHENWEEILAEAGQLYPAAFDLDLACRLGCK